MIYFRISDRHPALKCNFMKIKRKNFFIPLFRIRNIHIDINVRHYLTNFGTKNQKVFETRNASFEKDEKFIINGFLVSFFVCFTSAAVTEQYCTVLFFPTLSL